jgi:hypothetical protein
MQAFGMDDGPVLHAGDAAVIAATLLVPFLLVLLGFSLTFFREYDIRRWDVRLLVASTASLSMDLLVFALYEVMGVLPAAIRLLALRYLLVVVAVDLVLVVPFALAFTLALDLSAPPALAVLWAGASEMLFLAGFWELGAAFPVVSTGGHDVLSVEGSIGRLGVAGVTAAAILSGYGAVATPAGYLIGACTPHVRGKDIDAAKSAVRTALEDAVRANAASARARAAWHLAVAAASAAAASPRAGASPLLGGNSASPAIISVGSDDRQGGGRLNVVVTSSPFSPSLSRAQGGKSSVREEGWLRSLARWAWRGGGEGDGVFRRPRASPMDSPDNASASSLAESIAARLRADYKSTRQAAKLRAEVHAEAFGEYVEVIVTRSSQAWAQTGPGRLGRGLGFLLSGWGAYRVGLALVNIAFSRAPGPGSDPVTRVLELALMAAHVTPSSARMYVQPLSFVFVGALVAVSIRGFFLSFSRALSSLARTMSGRCVREGRAGSAASGIGATGAGRGRGGGSPVVLFLALITGLYSTASLLLLRSSVPEQYRGGIGAAVGAVHFPALHRWFDVVFLLSACAALIAVAASAALSAGAASRMGGGQTLREAAGGAVAASRPSVGGTSAAGSGYSDRTGASSAQVPGLRVRASMAQVTPATGGQETSARRELFGSKT